MDRQQKIQFIIDNIFPDVGDSGQALIHLLQRFTDREINVAMRVHLADKAGVLTDQDLRSLNRVFQKHGGRVNVETSFIQSSIPTDFFWN